MEGVNFQSLYVMGNKLLNCKIVRQIQRIWVRTRLPYVIVFQQGSLSNIQAFILQLVKRLHSCIERCLASFYDNPKLASGAIVITVSTIALQAMSQGSIPCGSTKSSKKIINFLISVDMLLIIFIVSLFVYIGFICFSLKTYILRVGETDIYKSSESHNLGICSSTLQPASNFLTIC